jgi:predicted PolB exonuclease-like 3'-5' exonuclease
VDVAPETVLIWDIETVPDLEGFAAANNLVGRPLEEIRNAMGDKFPKPFYHSIICIGALIAQPGLHGWKIKALGAPHVGERTEGDLIAAFVNRIAELGPQLVTFNGSGFDLPVLRYRAMINKIAAPGLSARSYFNRYTTDALDLCDALSSFGSSAKASLNELSRVMGLQGKPEDIAGSDVERFFREGKIGEIASYCGSDVVNTYRLWLRYELFRGELSLEDFEASEENLSAHR